MNRTFIILLCWASVVMAGAQTLTHRYVELADSADTYMKHENWTDAERVIVKALRHEPANKSNWLLWSNLGVVRTHLDNYDGAMEAYAVGLSSAPRSTVLLSNRAWTELTFGHTQDGLKDIDSTLALDSLQAWPLKMRGLLNMSKPEQARRDLLRSDSITPDDPAVLAGLGDLDAAQENIAGAMDYYKRSLKVRPEQEVAFRFLLIMTEQGDEVKARDWTVGALAKWPECAEMHLLRALQHQRSFQTDAALKEKNLAIAYGAEPLLVDAVLNLRRDKKSSKLINTH